MPSLTDEIAPILIPGDAANAVELSFALKVLVCCGYRLYRTTDHLEVYAPDPEADQGKLVMGGDKLDEEPVVLLRTDFGYYSHTWMEEREGIPSICYIWHEVTPDAQRMLRLVYQAIIGDGWSPERGWDPMRGGDRVGAWWEVTSRMAEHASLPDWIQVAPRVDRRSA